jgi:type IV pilus assembly protein PilY1
MRSKKEMWEMSSPKPEPSFVVEAGRMRPRRTPGLAALPALACLIASGTASAQVDTNPPLQNVMLLVDTSGSMEYATDGSKVTCDQVDATLTTEGKAASQKNRWTQLVEVLTGDITNFSCYTQDRASVSFRDEFRLAGVDPYDYNYHVPYHRIVSGSGATGCTIGAGVVDTNPFLWGATPWKYHLYNNVGTACGTFQQAETGLLDAYRDRVRFGLMTFDAAVDAGTGLTGSKADYPTANAGNWSYFVDWRANPTCSSNASCAKGRPAGCATSSNMEVGARNASAPPWEGRMVPFGSPVADIADVRTTNQRIQQVLTAVRPFGATPINGLLNDARDFFRSDLDDDYVSGTSCDIKTGVGCFGPSKDGFVAQGCRKNHIILLTDGEPNLDLRPTCEGTTAGIAGVCPYTDKSFEIVRDLAQPAGGKVPIQTYVIGFAVSNVDAGQPSPVDCSKISTKGTGGAGDTFDPQGLCGASMAPKLATCCTLAKIAFYGGSTNAHFVSNATELRAAMASILRGIDAKISTRTMPVFSGAANDSLGGAYSFYSSFRSDRADIWSGVLERQRTKCVAQASGAATIITPTDLPIDPALGDKFSENVAAADGSHPRTFYTVLPDVVAGLQWADRSIRPNIPVANPDGAGIQSGTLVTGTNADFFAPKIPATAMKVSKSACTDKPVPATDTACAAMFMKWELAVDNTPYVKRSDPFGAIYHSTPVLVGAPSEFLRDESYTQFVADQAKRPPMLYTATTDGQLHAFKVDVSPADKTDTFTIDKKVNNELWSFFPPAALPRIPSQYPGTEQVITDGLPVVKNVVFVRSAADAKSGGGSAQWRTVLVSGFGGGGPGYFALDVTNPVIKQSDPNSGPKMLWQLTTDAQGNRLFGKRGGTPAIATLFFGPGGIDPKEYAVAILPGGDSDSPLTGSCPQLGQAGPSSLVDSTKPARNLVRCWAKDPARSLTIVRLDTGEIVRSFRADEDGPATIAGRSHDAFGKDTKLNAPISGQPIPFPAMGGEVSDRAFVGDRDGMLWRADFASPNPQEWKMDLFFDAFTGQGPTDGQPIATAPILSVDRVGNVSVAFSTGDQETFLATTGMKNYQWSIVEKPTGTPPVFKSEAQWSLLLRDGERISGPMSLFASTLYYTTYLPAPFGGAQNCSAGQSRICAVHYLLPRGSAGEGGAIARPLLNTETDPCLQFGESVIFGAGITQKPTCNQETTYNDPYLGSGTHTALTNVNPGTFELKVQTGPSGSKPVGGETNVRTIPLQAPLTSTRIDSWAAVVE